MQWAQEIWYNADVLTMDPAQPRAQALAVADGRIITVGTDADVRTLAGPGTAEHNMHGQFIMPGLVESHTHALWGACRDLFDVFVGYAASLDDLLAATAARVAAQPEGAVVYGGPWRLDMREGMGADPKTLLDAISRTCPIILLDTSQHVMWCNTCALKAGGIETGTPDIPGGVIERLPSGAPNGILAETAGASVRRLLERSDQQLAEAARAFTRYFNSLGFTAFKEPMAYEEDLRAYHAADTRGELTLHMAAHIVRQSPMSCAPVPYATMEHLRDTYASENIRTGFAKLFLDGVAPGHTASFTEPYLASSGYDVAAHDPDATLLMSPEALNAELIALDARGFTVKMHAVGDNAIAKGLDAIEAARQANGPSGLRHEIAHTVFVSDADLARFRALDAIAEVSPKLWFPNPATPAQIAVLGADRLEKSHRIRDLLEAGAEMTYASDWPASAPDPNPWPGLAGMLTRRNVDPAYPGTVAPDQAISLDQALPLFTRNGARSLGMGHETGTLALGKWADFIVLDQPLSRRDPLEIGHTTVQQTIWKGRVVHAL